MRSWMKAVLSFTAARYRAIRSRPGVTLLLVAFVGVAAVAGHRLLESHREVNSPGLYQAVNKFLDKGRDALEAIVEAPRNLSESSQPTTIPADVASDGWGRRIIRKATLNLELADVDQGLARLTAIAESAGGFVGSTETQTDTRGTARATITAYVPPAQFARVLAGLDGAGRVTRRWIGGQDVSEEFVDLGARIRNLERHEAQLLSFMGKAHKVQDLLSLENELARVRGEIERAAGRLRFLKARTDLATIQVVLIRAPLAAPPDALLARFVEQLKEAFSDGWSTAFRVALTVAVLTAQLSPLAIPALAAWLIYRRRAGRRLNPLASPPLGGP